MYRCDRSGAPVGQEHGDAVGRPDGNRRAGATGHEDVGLSGRRRVLSLAADDDSGSVHLCRGHELLRTRLARQRSADLRRQLWLAAAEQVRSDGIEGPAAQRGAP
jgi:hypothetical protein